MPRGGHHSKSLCPGNTLYHVNGDIKAPGRSAKFEIGFQVDKSSWWTGWNSLLYSGFARGGGGAEQERQNSGKTCVPDPMRDGWERIKRTREKHWGL